MKKLIVIVGLLCLLVNYLFGVLLSAYADFNVGLNSGVILVNTLLLYGVSALSLKDGFKVSLSCLFSFMTLVEYVVCLFVPARVEDNGYLIGIIVVLLIEVMILIGAGFASNKK